MDSRKMARMGQRAMREQQSAAEKIFWPLLAGRTRQTAPNILEAVNMGRTVANRLYGSMREA
ncbi:MAG: hypothetical protein ROO76_06845, partial [Terriglobia bacterium]|nr:hypothetical protein [Terriglobia bacterium]